MMAPMRWLLLASILLGIAICVQTFLDPQAWSHRKKLTFELQELQKQNEEAAGQTEALRGQIEALRSRPDVQEHVIRDQMGYERPRDIIIDLRPAR